MAWLWMISVGVTDVQFPVWSKDESGMWTVLRRFETGRAGIRAVHEGLLALLRNGQIRFEGGLPKPIHRDVARDLRLEFVQEGADFLMTIRHADYRISDQADTIPNTHEAQLPLYCPKVEALLPIARETFADGPVTVLVLNTRRADDFSEAPLEPIAAGPLVAKCLAERLGLRWVDGGGQVPNDLASGTSTWIDILTDNEPMEDVDVQKSVVARLCAALRAWDPDCPATNGVAVTTSGGMPVFKPLIERVPAICFGQDRVTLLDQPERGTAQAVALSYDNRVTEREVLRFHCAEALRHGDYAGAYGLASRAASQPWAKEVRNGLGALLEFPGAPLQPNGRNLEPIALTACQIEVRLCLGDVIGALIRLGTFVESSIWKLIAQDSRIHSLGLKVDRNNECLVGNLKPDHHLFKDKMLEQNAKGKHHHRVLGLTWLWLKWLEKPITDQAKVAKVLKDFHKRYEKKPKILRNRLVHGINVPIDPQDVRQCMMDGGLIEGVGHPFGQNFLSVTDVNRLLTGLGEVDLTAAVGGHLKAVLNRVIEG
jgi:hypothetical protein